MFGVHSGRDCTCRWILCYLSGLVVLKTVKDRSIFRRKVAALMRRTDRGQRCRVRRQVSSIEDAGCGLTAEQEDI